MSFFHCLFDYFFVRLQLLQFIMGGIIILAFPNVVVIKQMYSIILKIVSLKVLNKENLPFWGLEKWDLEKLVQKT